MPRTANNTALIVFAKAPRPGAAKTRLVPLLGAEGAAALHARLIRHSLATACASGLRPLELHGAPDAEDPFLRGCADVCDIPLVPQTGDELGERMRNALERALANVPRVILIGTDCAALTVRHLREARDALVARNDAVFVPTEDGGFALIGATRCESRLFEGIAWGGAVVMSAMRTRLAAMGWRWQELETLWDVDRPGDYERLVASGLMDRPRTHV